ncbi:MAG: hypothetical protein ACE141_11290 [Bryobacteraceae bacterium]
MSGFVRGCVCLAACLVLIGAERARPQSAGVPQEWEVRRDLSSLVEQTGRLRPLLDAVKTAEWVDKGAPASYASQWKAVVDESDYLARSAHELAADPERLTLALETYLRLESLDAQLNSLNEGIRRYQNPALADLIRGAMTDGAPARDRLRRYVVQLAALKEDQLRVADQEAQRCRTILLQKAPAQKGPGQKAAPK